MDYPYPTLNPSGDAAVEMTNPITRSGVRLEPPYRFTDYSEVCELKEKFDKFCEAAWDIENAWGGENAVMRRNPAVVDPYRLMDGTAKLVGLDTVLADLVAEYGYYYVHHRLCEQEPAGRGLDDAGFATAGS